LEQLRDWLATDQRGAKDEEERAHLFATVSQIVQFQKDPKQISVAPRPSRPMDHPLARMTMGTAGLRIWQSAA